MRDVDDILDFVETLVKQTLDTHLSDLQRHILISSVQEDRKTYDQLAEDCGYSARYIKQDVAPKFWHILSEALKKKITKATARGVLEQAMLDAPPPIKPPPIEVAPKSAPSSAATTTAQIPTTATSISRPSLSDATILLVDDQPKNLRLLSSLLEEQGYEVHQARNGKLALRSVAIDQPDLILLDIRMPEIDGYTVCQQLKDNSKTKDIPIIFISAMDEAWDKAKAFFVGGSDYITKPFKVFEVLARVENQLKIQQLQRTLKAQNLKLQETIHALQKSVDIDHLTQVASRERLDNYLQAFWQQSTQFSTSLVFMLAQIDNFNFYSPNGNQAQGDQSLFQVGQCLKQTIQKTDGIVGRYATLTFGIVFAQQTNAEGEQIAQEILSQIQALNTLADKISLSIGMLTVVANSGPNPETISGADLESEIESCWQVCEQNLQQAIGSGGNCFGSTF
ncbi:MAG: response regulator [Cyanobacteria bacterium J06621_11]